MSYYGIVTEGQPPSNLPEFEPWTARVVPSHEEIQKIVGIDGVPTTYEILDMSNFSDPKIVMIVDSDLEPKGLKATCITVEGAVLFGRVLILGTGKSLDDLCLLNLAQTRIVKQEIKLCKPRFSPALRCAEPIVFNLSKSMFYVLINSKGIQEVEATELPSVKGMQDLVGIPGESAAFQAVHGCYTDHSLVVLCDDEFLRKDPEPVLVTYRGTLQGQLIVVALNNQRDDYTLLTQDQVELVKRESVLA